MAFYERSRIFAAKLALGDSSVMRILPVLIAVVGLCLPALAQADVLSTKSRSNLFKSQTNVLDTRAKQQYNNSIRLQPQKIRTPTKWGSAEGVGRSYNGKYRGRFLQMAKDAPVAMVCRKTCSCVWCSRNRVGNLRCGRTKGQSGWRS